MTEAIVSQKNRYPNTVLLRGGEIPEKYRGSFSVDLRKLKAYIEYVSVSGGSTTTNITANIPLPEVMSLPAECRVWHRACARRAGLEEWFPWKVDRDVSCYGCGRKLPRRAGSRGKSGR